MTLTSRRQLVLILAVALAIRLVAAWAWQERIGGRFALGDSESYWQLGRAIAEGQPYQYGIEHARVFRTPGYPLLLAPIVWLAGDGWNGILAARLEAAVFGTLAVLAVWWLARLLFDERTASIAAILAAFYPGAIALSALVLSEAPFCPLMLLQLGLWMVACRATSARGRAGWGGATGLTAGAATLVRPDWLLFTPMAAILYVLSRRSSKETNLSASTAKRERIIMGCWMMLGLVLVMLPWWIRNACVTGRFVPTTLQVGASLYDGLNEHATGASNMNFVPPFMAKIERQGGPRPGDPAFELRLDRDLRDAALDWVAANPVQALRLAGFKFLRMWNIWPNEPQLTRNAIARWGVVFTYTPLLILAIMGAWRTVRRGWPYILCCLPAVYLTLLHVVFVSSIRYREPAMLALLALAAGELAWWIQGRRVRGTHR